MGETGHLGEGEGEEEEEQIIGLWVIACLSSIRIKIAREREADGRLSFLINCVSEVKSIANDVGDEGRPRGKGAKRDRVMAGTVAQRGYKLVMCCGYR